mmetsp:Transcript_58357/g.110012  ORF Transcript_58357/g.110012 Transcript_58357/m.110012 type:complete len:148 (-) Transcript_58357:121-564(-)
METFSYKAFCHENTSMLLDMNRTGSEDSLISEQMWKAGFQILVNDRVEDCNTMFLDYDNIPGDDPNQMYLRSRAPDQMNVSIIADAMRELFYVPALHAKQLPEAFNATPNCVHADVVMAHPIKDVATYEELQYADKHKGTYTYEEST